MDIYLNLLTMQYSGIFKLQNSNLIFKPNLFMINAAVGDYNHDLCYSYPIELRSLLSNKLRSKGINLNT
jgi:hypothetical protein